ncbi:MAG: RagB/SusD family nutrient uptake outer membrane protein [Prevotellaceae bacterium]|jgi:hypothetical protein|nr:RagB/SusD family nutrient uptake outer membrane protein [Prevotellaceae bacterium]
MKIKIFLFIAALQLPLASCDYLDIVPDGIPDIEQHAFAMRTQAEKFLFTCYNCIPTTGSITANPAFLAGHEIAITTTSRSYNGTNAYYIQQGLQRTSSPYICYWNGGNGGKNLWRGISDCNIFLEHVNEVPDMTISERSQWAAEVEFLKVYYHYYLVKMYGPIPIKDKNIAVSASEEEVKVFRNTLDECFDYMLGKLDKIIAESVDGMGLMDNIDGVETQMAGRITKGIAMMLRAQIAVTAASPLFNGNTMYRGITDSRGVEIFNPNKTADEKQQRWTYAAQACDEAYKFLTSKGHNLYTYTPGHSTSEAEMSERTKDKLSIRMALNDPFNIEVVWANSNNWVGASNISYGDLQNQSHPRDFTSERKSTNSNHRGNFAVPLKVARQFFTQNGLPIERDKEWANVNPLDVFEVKADDSMFLHPGYSTIRFNKNRELRYYASLGFDGGVWYGQGDATDHSQYLQARQGGAAANTIDNSWNLTGIFPKKLLHHKTQFAAGSVTAPTTSCTAERYPWPLMRMNELILLCAEAFNEVGEMGKAKEMLNKVRTRAKLPDIDVAYSMYSNAAGRVNSKEGLRQIIREERMSELALEGYRYWDLLRWQTAEDDFSKPITGWTLSGKDPAAYYIESPVFPVAINFSKPRDYFAPIPTDEILRNRNILQNPGW